MLEGFDFVGVERQDTEEEPFASIARARIAWWEANPEGLEIIRERERREAAAELRRAAVAETGQMDLLGG